MLTVAPISFKVACSYVLQLHRHHGPPQGHKFSVGLYLDGVLVGVAICGRPVSRVLDDGKTLEVTRLCVPAGVKNGCSKLYGACRRRAKVMRYRKLITYTLVSESGVSLKASNFVNVHLTKGRSWSCLSRPRNARYLLSDKYRWEITI